MPRTCSLNSLLLALPAAMLAISAHGAGTPADGRPAAKGKAPKVERSEQKVLVLEETLLLAYAQTARPFGVEDADLRSLLDVSPHDFFVRTWATGVAAKSLAIGAAGEGMSTNLDAGSLLGGPLGAWKTMSLPTRAYLAGAMTYLLDVKQRRDFNRPLRLEGSEVDAYILRFKTSSLMLLNCAEGMAAAAQIARSNRAPIDRGDTVKDLLLMCRMQWLPGS